MNCPFCREQQIQDGAIKCRYCNEMLGGFRPGDRVVATRMVGQAKSAVACTKRVPRFASPGVLDLHRRLPAAPTRGQGRRQRCRLSQSWSDRAETAVRRSINSNSDVIAQSIVAITHPTGEKARLQRHEITALQDGMSVRLYVAWNGGLIGTSYVTEVQWEFDEREHRSAKVVADTTMIGPGFADQLDDY